MNMLFLILGLATASTSYELVKIPVGVVAKKITCEQAFKKHTVSVENPNYKAGNNEPMTYMKYKGRTVFFHYCNDSFGKYIP
tara:strand:+ start:98 stop:343 length:246 start_codon:yes stop_codon:yes gene_type:complete